MEIGCPTCRQPIPAEEVNVQLAIAKCPACNVLFSFAEQVGGGRAAVRERVAVPMPKSIRVEEFGPDLVISWRWWQWPILFLVFFCIAWDGFLVFWYTMAFVEHAPLIMVLFPIAHLAVGVGLTYFVLCSLVNRTEVSVRGGMLGVRHGPLPWRGNREMADGDIDQIYCKYKTHRGRNGESTSYEVHAITRDNRRVTLLKGLEEEDQALFIEQALEQRLGIQDRAVPGEVRK